MGTAKPIETKYAGYRFRSRLEARYAVFLDALGVQWQYENEGYQLQSGWYLPDFWLPEHRVWLEIKPTTPSERERVRVLELREANTTFDHHWCTIIYGNVGHAGIVGFNGRRWNLPIDTRLASCGECGQIVFAERDASVWCTGHTFYGLCHKCGYDNLYGKWRQHNYPGCVDDEAVIRAVESARSARFEFGEQGGRAQ